MKLEEVETELGKRISFFCLIEIPNTQHLTNEENFQDKYYIYDIESGNEGFVLIEDETVYFGIIKFMLDFGCEIKQEKDVIK